MEQLQAAVVFNSSEPKPNPTIWIKISYPEGYKGFKGWPEGTIKRYRKDAADLIIQRGLAVQVEAPAGEEDDTDIDIDTGDTGDTEDADTGDADVQDSDTEDADTVKNKTGKKRKK